MARVHGLGSCLVVGLVLAACADFEGGDIPPECKDGEAKCEGKSWKTCVDGFWTSEDCSKTQRTCLDKLGCKVCAPSTKYCRGQDIFQCSPDGNRETKISSCRDDQQCALGKCYDFCDLPQSSRSNVGCVFWAVDLPNEYYCTSLDGGATCLLYGCAACQQFAVAVANTSTYNVTVTVEQNTANPGEALKLSTVLKKTLGPNSLEVIKLPMREVDCSEWATDKAGKLRRKTDSQTCLSSKAYRITSSYPIVAYQFNPIVNDFSNGASLLIPVNGLDKDYYVMGWSTANPLDLIPIPGKVLEGTPDYMNLTVVGVKEGTKVSVKLTHPTQGSKDGKIPAGKKGDTITATIGPFDVLNINTIQNLFEPTGDLTGTLVQASQPVVVFSGGARSVVPTSVKDYTPPPPEPSDPKYSVCCTEHFEQQMFPVSSLGTAFAITRTPVRSTSTIIEPDFYRILATEDSTTVTTTLSNFTKFTLKKGEVGNFWSTTPFGIESDKPIMLAQYAVCQGFLDNWSGAGGDPEFVVFAPVEQHRSEYIFLTPTTFDKDFVVIAAPLNATVHLDNQEITGEFKTLCTQTSLGKVKGTDYVEIKCPVKDGVHRVKGSKPVGITVYGYYAVGSYGYPGGADVKQINVD